MKHLLSLLAINVLLFACTNKNTNTTTVQKEVSVDSLEKVWDDTWNGKDIEAFKNLLADNVIVFENEWMVSGKDSVVEKFVKPNFTGTKNLILKTTKVMDGVSEGMAYRVGEYSMIRQDSAIVHHKGPFTLIWKKQADNKWKVEVMQTGTIK